jgi:hypothetical protein
MPSGSSGLLLNTGTSIVRVPLKPEANFIFKSHNLHNTESYEIFSPVVTVKFASGCDCGLLLC